MTSTVEHAHAALTDVLSGRLAGLLADWLPRQRWYGGKGARIDAEGVRLLHRLDLLGPGRDPGLQLAVVEVHPHGRDPERYLLFFGLRRSLPESLAHAELGRVVDDRGVDRACYDALHDPELAGWLLGRLAAGEEVGPLRFHLLPGRAPAKGLRSLVLTGEQSNTSVIYGDKLIAKFLRRAVAGVNPDLELSLALADSGSRNIPQPVGWIDLNLELPPLPAPGAVAGGVAEVAGNGGTAGSGSVTGHGGAGGNSGTAGNGSVAGNGGAGGSAGPSGAAQGVRAAGSGNGAAGGGVDPAAGFHSRSTGTGSHPDGPGMGRPAYPGSEQDPALGRSDYPGSEQDAALGRSDYAVRDQNPALGRSGRDDAVEADLGRPDYRDRGAAGYQGYAGPEPLTVATVSEFLPTATDGWLLAQASVRDLYNQPRGTGPREAGGDFTPESHRLGQATARVHHDLATALPTGRMEPEELARVAEAMVRHLHLAAVRVPALSPHVPALRKALSELGSLDKPVLTQRVHGDFHLGQVMRTVNGWVLLDFEGEPSRSLEERRAMAPSIKDVAGMARSFDYAAHHLGGDPERAAEWAEANFEAFCEGYAEASGQDPREQAVLLRGYAIDKAVYEAVYEAANRPSWLPIPLTAVARLAEAV